MGKFKDQLGRVILTRKFLSGQNVDTYNVYDIYGQLVAVLPPGSETNGVVISDLIFQYQYDAKGRLMEKKIPGSAAQKFYYDARDLLVLTQDGNMRAASSQKHLATEYDALGRVKKTGFVMISPTAGQDYTAAIAITDAERLTEMEYYPNKSWVKHQGARVLKPAGVNTPTEFVWSYVERRDALNYTGNPVWTGKQHLMSSSVPQRKIEDSDWQGVDWSVTGVNGAQQPTLTIRYLNGGGVSDVRTWQEFSYDHGMRLTDQKYLYTLNGAGLSAPTFTLANMVYNYKDQLIEKNIGYRGTNNALQSIDYQYNTRGWLTAINNVGLSGGTSSLLTPSMQGAGVISQLAITPYINAAIQKQLEEVAPPMTDNNGDLFSQILTYESPDSRTGAAPQKNGNISSTMWQVAGRDKQAYGFKYDDLNRLTEANYYDIVGTANTFSTDNKFQEKLTYDLRGNIETLQRKGLNGGSWTSNGFTAATYGLMDNLSYTYGTGNQLSQVRDYSLLNKGFKSVNNPNSTQYTYDANGNLKSDLNKGITNIEYNALNLPQIVTFTNNRELQFVYDASGVKLRKIVLENGVVKETRDYVNGVEYKDRALERVSHSEGAVVRNDFGQYQHEFVLRDHLGNTRVTFRDGVNKGEPYWDWSNYTYHAPDNTGYDDGIVTKDDIVQINHFYPFGLNMEGDWNGSQGKNKYQYNGKEWNEDFGLGWNHHDWRFYDVALGRFVTIDRLPEEEEQEQLSPYHFSYNNPIRYDDPDGQCPTCFTAAGMALLEGGIELAGQLLENGGDIRKVDWVDVGVEAIKGAATGSGAGLFARGALEVTGEVVKAGADGSIEGGLETVVTKDEQGKRTKTLSEAGIDLAVGVIGGKLGDKAVDKGVSSLQKGASKAKDVASAKTQAAKFATDRAKELKKGGEPARSAAAAKGAKMTSRDAKHAQMNSAVKKTVANKAKTPLRVVSGAAQNRVSNVAKDKTDAANRH